MKDVKSRVSANIPLKAPTKFEKDVTPLPVYICAQDQTDKNVLG